MSKKKPYRVGYGKPPLETRFKPGQSGNRKGRSKKQGKTDAGGINSAEDLWRLIYFEGTRRAKVKEHDGKEHEVPAIQSVYRAELDRAAKGKGSAKLAVELFRESLVAAERNRQQISEFISALNNDEVFRKDISAEYKRDTGHDLPEIESIRCSDKGVTWDRSISESDRVMLEELEHDKSMLRRYIPGETREETRNRESGIARIDRRIEIIHRTTVSWRRLYLADSGLR